MRSGPVTGAAPRRRGHTFPAAGKPPCDRNGLLRRGASALDPQGRESGRAHSRGLQMPSSGAAVPQRTAPASGGSGGKAQPLRRLEEADWACAQTDLPPRPVCGSQLRKLPLRKSGSTRAGCPCRSSPVTAQLPAAAPCPPLTLDARGDVEGARPSTPSPLDVRCPESRWPAPRLAHHLSSRRNIGAAARSSRSQLLVTTGSRFLQRAHLVSC